MGLINARVFGSDIPRKVKRKLEARQRAASEKKSPNDPILDSKYSADQSTKYSELLNNQFGGESELSSRTPFVRVWTALDFREKIDPDQEEAFEPIPFQNQFGWDVEGFNNMQLALEYAAAAKMDDPSKHKGKPGNKSLFLYTGGNKDTFGGQIFPRATVIQKGDKYYVQQLKINRIFKQPKVYTLNTNNVNELTKGKDIYQSVVGVGGPRPTDPFSIQSADDATAIVSEDALFPDEHDVQGDENKFMKPAAGITGMVSETEGTLGVIKKTTITFHVYNFADYDSIYMKYFMRPGAQLFIDYGWSNVQNLYDPATVLTTEGNESFMQRLLFDEDVGVVSKHQGDLDTIVGLVTEYESIMLPEGGVECTVTVTSKNSAMLGESIHTQRERRIDFLVDDIITFEALYTTADAEERKALLNSIPGNDTDPADRKSFNEKIEHIESLTSSNRYEEVYEDEKDEENNKTGKKIFKGYKYKGSRFDYGHSYTGVWKDSQNGEKFLCWGLIEDKILNGEFGFAADIEDINSSSATDKTNFQISIDSSESYTRFDPKIWEMQEVVTAANEGNMNTIVPPVWGSNYMYEHTENGKSEWFESPYFDTYNTRKQKRPEFYQLLLRIFEEQDSGEFDYTKNGKGNITPGGNTFTGIGAAGGKPPLPNFTNIDVKNQRIPIREIFVNAQVVKDAFNSGNTCKQAIEEMLDVINNDISDGYYDWRLVSAPGDDSSLSIIDYGFLGINKDKEKQAKDVYDNLFMFDVSGKNSIVQSYDLSLNIPEGDIGSMLAIQGLSSTTQTIKANSLMDEALAHTFLLADSGDSYVTYLPEIANYRTERIQQDLNVDDGFYGMYKNSIDFLNIPDTFGDKGWSVYDHAHIESSEKTGLIYESAAEMSSDTDSWDDADAVPKKRSTTDINALITEDETLLAESGFSIKSTLKSFYAMSIAETYFNDSTISGRPVPFNFLNLTLTLQGVSSLQPGDIFRVNHLPKMYLDNVYFQVIKVSHEITPEGWMTILQTQFRMRPEKKSDIDISYQSVGTYLSAKLLSTLEPNPIKVQDRGGKSLMGFNNGRGVGKNSKDAPALKQIMGYTSRITPYTPEWLFSNPHCKISHMYEFTANKTITRDDGFWQPESSKYPRMRFDKDSLEQGIFWFPMDTYMTALTPGSGYAAHFRRKMDADFAHFRNGWLHFTDGVYPSALSIYHSDDEEKQSSIFAHNLTMSTIGKPNEFMDYSGNYTRYFMYSRLREQDPRMANYPGSAWGRNTIFNKKKPMWPCGWRIEHEGYGSRNLLDPGYWHFFRRWEKVLPGWPDSFDDAQDGKWGKALVASVMDGGGLEARHFYHPHFAWLDVNSNARNPKEAADSCYERSVWPFHIWRSDAGFQGIYDDGLEYSKTKARGNEMKGSYAPESQYDNEIHSAHYQDRYGTTLVKGRKYVIIFNQSNPGGHWMIVDKERLEANPKKKYMMTGQKDLRWQGGYDSKAQKYQQYKTEEEWLSWAQILGVPIPGDPDFDEAAAERYTQWQIENGIGSKSTFFYKDANGNWRFNEKILEDLYLEKIYGTPDNAMGISARGEYDMGANLLFNPMGLAGIASNFDSTDRPDWFNITWGSSVSLTDFRKRFGEKYWEGSTMGYRDSTNWNTEWGRGGDGFNISEGFNAPGLKDKLIYTWAGRKVSYSINCHSTNFSKMENPVYEQWWWRNSGTAPVLTNEPKDTDDHPSLIYKIDGKGPYPPTSWANKTDDW